MTKNIYNYLHITGLIPDKMLRTIALGKPVQAGGGEIKLSLAYINESRHNENCQK
jgi:hypothetical protein